MIAVPEKSVTFPVVYGGNKGNLFLFLSTASNPIKSITFRYAFDEIPIKYLQVQFLNGLIKSVGFIDETSLTKIFHTNNGKEIITNITLALNDDDDDNNYLSHIVIYSGKSSESFDVGIKTMSSKKLDLQVGKGILVGVTGRNNCGITGLGFLFAK